MTTTSNSVKMGRNRTGLATSPHQLQAMLQATQEFPPSSHGSSQLLAETRVEYSLQGEQVGSVPPPVSVKGIAKAAMAAVSMMESPSILIDKLGERMAFEAAGTRLYDALISKYEAFGSFENGPSLEELQSIRADEHRHFLLVKEAIESMGGDPTAVTPSANVTAVISLGLPKALTDPRITLLQSLEAILVAELVDNDCWQALIELVTLAGQNEIASRFEQALSDEEEHLRKVRMWLAAGQGREEAYSEFASEV